MRVSAVRRFAVNAMIDLALREQAGPVALASIAERQHVSVSYLEQLFARLRAADLVKSTRGPGGGYSLGRDAAAISVADIVGAVEKGSPDAQEEDGAPCLASDLSQRLDAVMQVHMAGIALAALVAGQQAAEVIVKVRRRHTGLAPRPPLRAKSATVPNSVFDLGKVMAVAGGRPLGR